LEAIENGNYQKSFPDGEFKTKMIQAAKDRFGIEQKIEHQIEHTVEQQFPKVENEKKNSKYGDEIWDSK